MEAHGVKNLAIFLWREIGVHNLAEIWFLYRVCSWDSGHISDCVPPTSDDHIFRFRTPFQVFLDFMESPLSPNYLHVPLEGSG